MQIIAAGILAAMSGAMFWLTYIAWIGRLLLTYGILYFVLTFRYGVEKMTDKIKSSHSYGGYDLAASITSNTY